MKNSVETFTSFKSDSVKLLCFVSVTSSSSGVTTVQWVRGGHNLATEDKTENTK